MKSDVFANALFNSKRSFATPILRVQYEWSSKLRWKPQLFDCYSHRIGVMPEDSPDMPVRDIVGAYGAKSAILRTRRSRKHAINRWAPTYWQDLVDIDSSLRLTSSSPLRYISNEARRRTSPSTFGLRSSAVIQQQMESEWPVAVLLSYSSPYR